MTFTDRPVEVGNEHGNRTGFAQGSYSRPSAPSITIDSEMDYDDEPSASQALVSKGDQGGLTRTSSTFTSEDSDDDLYESVKSDIGDDYVSLLSSRSS
jgi:hypothetical protein